MPDPSYRVVLDIETAAGNPPEAVEKELKAPIFERLQQELDSVRPDGRYTDLAKINASCQRKRLEAQERYNEKLAKLRQDYPLHWYCGQIIAIGIMPIDGEKVVFFQDGERIDEATLLAFAWNYLQTHQNKVNHQIQFITYGGKEFDANFILFRSALLGIAPTVCLSTHKYRTETHIDLRDVFGEKSQAFWAAVFGVPLSTSYSGADVPLLWQQKRYQEIVGKCSSDLDSLESLFKKIAPYLFLEQ